MRLITNFLLSILLLYGCDTKTTEFQLCSRAIYPYYNPTLRYKGGFHEIKRHFYQNYKKKHGLANNTGIVRIRFDVNCSGVTGNYSIETYGLDYKKDYVNTEIVNELHGLIKALNNWIPALNEKGERVDSHKFFAFKLVDGKLKDILPK